MLGIIKHPLSDARWLEAPATVAGIRTDTYLAALRDVVSPSKGKMLSTDDINLRVFTRWVTRAYGPDGVLVMDESVLERLEADMVSGTFTGLTKGRYTSLIKQVPAGIVHLHNRAFDARQPSVTRPLVDSRTLPRYRYFLTLTPTTQRALVWFETSGVRPGKAGATTTMLTVASRRLGINEALWLLRRLETDGLEKITADMINGLIPRTGPDDPDYRRIIRSLNGVNAIFRSCVAAGHLPKNPTQHVAHNTFTNYQQRDFLPPGELDKIRDLKTLDMRDDLRVMDRLVLLLLVDTALRRGELASISITQITRMDGGYTIHLGSRNQKMVGKKAVDIPLLYPETNKLMGVYLTRIRPKLAVQDAEGLLVDRKGYPTSGPTLGAACKREGKRLGLVTYHRKAAPSPHDLRRTFAMNNASPLGLNLQANELAERLRDGIQTVFAHYVTSNPLITAHRAQVYRKRVGDVIDDEKVHDVMEALRKWGVSAGLMGKLDREIRTLRVKSEAPKQEQRVGETEWMDEDAAYKLLAERWGQVPFWKKFRGFMRERKALRRAARFGKVCFDAKLIRAIAEEYVPAGTLKGNAMVDRVRLADALRGDSTIVIGRLALVRKETAWSLLNLEPTRARKSSNVPSVQTSPGDRSKHPSKPEPVLHENAV